MMQKIYRLLTFSILLGVLLYTGGYLLWRLVLISPLYEAYWQVQITEIFGSWFYLPLLPLILLVLLTRQWRASRLLLIPLAFFSWEYGAQFLPNWQHGLTATVQAQGASNSLRVMTWNTYHTYDPKEDFFQLVREIQPDVVTLQEVSAGMTRKAREDLKDEYPYQYYQPFGTLLTLSRHPAAEPKVDRLLRMGCRCLPLEITKNGHSFTIINTHIPRPTVQYDLLGNIPTISYYDPRGQELHFKVLFKILGELEGTTLVQGDFNTTERQKNFRLLTQHLTDSFAEAGWGMGFTYPHTEAKRPFWLVPLIQIDHILHSPDLRARAAWNGSLKSSDHLYVVADLYWP